MTQMALVTLWMHNRRVDYQILKALQIAATALKRGFYEPVLPLSPDRETFWQWQFFVDQERF